MNGRIRKEHIKKLAESPPDREAYKRFKSPPYQVGRLIRAQGEQMTVRALVDRIYEMVNKGQLKMSDPVPEDLLRQDMVGNKTVAEYVAQKYNIKTGGDASGQEEAETVPGITKRAEAE